MFRPKFRRSNYRTKELLAEDFTLEFLALGGATPARAHFEALRH
jgi:hypothetical protein